MCSLQSNRSEPAHWRIRSRVAKGARRFDAKPRLPGRAAQSVTTRHGRACAALLRRRNWIGRSGAALLDFLLMGYSFERGRDVSAQPRKLISTYWLRGTIRGV